MFALFVSACPDSRGPRIAILIHCADRGSRLTDGGWCLDVYIPILSSTHYPALPSLTIVKAGHQQVRIIDAERTISLLYLFMNQILYTGTPPQAHFLVGLDST